LTISYALFNTSTNQNVDPINGQFNGGEFRLFPCKNTPNDNLHSTISVMVWIAPNKSNVRVWARSIDVDDPMWSTAPIDNEEDPQDNRTSPGGTIRGGILKWPGGGAVADNQGRL